jgi:SAM-dependent methyltransferase
MKSKYTGNKMVETQTKSKQRVADHGEVFTAEREVNAMLDLVKQETERIDSRFLEPACGNGNFLAEILRRKLAVVKSRYKRSADDYERYAVIAVSSIYGIDLLQDNVDECRSRLFGIFNAEYSVICKKNANDDTREAVRHILKHNIICGNALTLKTSNGSPIIFAEWSAVNGYLLKRRDFAFEELTGQSNENPLFSSSKTITNDIGQTVFLPQTVAEFKPVHYKKVQQYE